MICNVRMFNSLHSPHVRKALQGLKLDAEGFVVDSSTKDREGKDEEVDVFKYTAISIHSKFIELKEYDCICVLCTCMHILYNVQIYHAMLTRHGGILHIFLLA